MRSESIRLDFSLEINVIQLSEALRIKKVFLTVNEGVAKEFIDSDLRLILGAEMGKVKLVYMSQFGTGH